MVGTAGLPPDEAPGRSPGTCFSGSGSRLHMIISVVNDLLPPPGGGSGLELLVSVPQGLQAPLDLFPVQTKPGQVVVFAPGAGRTGSSGGQDL